MSKRIYKYPFPVQNISEVKLPGDAKILRVDEQAIGSVWLWAEVEVNNRKEPSYPIGTRRFRVVGTGHDFEEEEVYRYITSFFMLENRAGMFHVYEAR